MNVTLGGTLQARYSIGWTAPTDRRQEELERVGFGLRRARLRVRTEIGPRAGLYLQVDGASGTLAAVDAYAFYRLTDHLQLRLGRLVSAQPRSALLTSHSRLDAIDRAVIAEQWTRRTLGSDGRDFGLEALYTSERGTARLFLHNGDGSWNRLRGNYRESISAGQVTRGVEQTRMAASLSLSYHLPLLSGLEAGGFASYNGARNPNTAVGNTGRDYATYGAHLYWGAEPGSQHFRAKLDVIGLHYETPGNLRPDDLLDQNTLGLSVLGAVRLHPSAEVFGRVEAFNPDTDASRGNDVYVTAGGSVSLSALRGAPYHRERLTLAYSLLDPDASSAARQHLIVLQAQFIF